MSVIKGLDKIRQKIDERPQGFDNVSERELTRNIKPGGARTIRFVQELDETSENYDERYGLALVVSEHEHPEHFWLRLVDTFEEEGASWPAEQGWKSKLNLYINVVDVDTGDVFYLSRSVLGGLGAQIIESAGERESLTDGVWKIKKEGKGFNTKYTLTLVNLTDESLEVDPDDLIDFEESLLTQVPYGEQESHVRQIEQRVAAKRADTVTEDDDDDDVW